ncbi:unnamed protein product [Pylaiella littoralis]
MDMEELLGLEAGDFEGVEFGASSDSDGEEQHKAPDEGGGGSSSSSSSSSGGIAPAVAAAETNDSSSLGGGMAAAVAAPAGGGSSSSSGMTTTVTKARESATTPFGTNDGSITSSYRYSSIGDSSESLVVVDAERGSPLPEHACYPSLTSKENGTTTTAEAGGAAGAARAAENLTLLRKVERCCLEAHPAEIEEAVAALSSCLGTAAAGVGVGGDDSAGNTAETAAGGGGGGSIAVAVKRSSGEEEIGQSSSPGGASRATVEAAHTACRAALRLCRGEYEELLRGTALFSGSGQDQQDAGDNSSSSSNDLRARVKAFVVGDASDGGIDGGCPAAAVWRAAEAAWAGAAALSLFLQENYAGPELGADRTDAIDAWTLKVLTSTYVSVGGLGAEAGGSGGGVACSAESAARDLANIALACDGELPYPRSTLAGSLVAARTILTAVAGTGTRTETVTASSLDDDNSGSGSSSSRQRPVLSVWSADGSSTSALLSAVAVPSSSPGVSPPTTADTAGNNNASGRGSGGSAAGAATTATSSSSSEPREAVFHAAAGSLTSASWWSARACVTHARLLISSSGRSDTLWREARELFGRAVRLFGGGGGVGMGPAAAAARREGVQGREVVVARRVAGQVWLEWGLAQHHFQDPTKGKESFARAKEASGLTAGLTGALGKRTKYQQSQLAQLVLVASSATTPVADAVEAVDSGADGGAPVTPEEAIPATANALPAETSGDGSGSSNSGGGGGGGGGGTSRDEGKSGAQGAVGAGAGVGVTAGPELGMSTAVGEEGRRAAARQTIHAEDSALLEDISFVEQDLENPGKLQDVDLAIILGLCLDVSNSNPRDGLTNEQMTPYIARVLRQPGCNWMIYSTALLQRAWVEFERSHARDRAALQLQALLDQHTTKLTYMQSTIETIEDSAPVQDRLRYLCSLSFPPRWELRRDLARRYAGMGVLGSAASEFVDLEMWEEAVECYRQMQQVHKAEKIARERLKEKETPAMLAALGDLTQDPECWQRAWDLSGKRYARAQASLARMRFAEGKYEEACGHYEQALAVKPLLTAAWFSLGVARMRLNRWQESLQAFSTVAQQEPEEGEAWGNMGAVHMHEGNWAGAAAAFMQGLKQMPGNWRMWENQAEALIRLGRWSSAAYACHRMLDLSDKSKRGVDAEYLALLVEGALKQEPLGSNTPSCMSGAQPPPAPEPATAAAAAPNGTAAGETGGGGGRGGSGDDLAGRPLCKQVAELLGRVVSTTSTRGDARVWEVYARFNEGAGRDRSRVLDCVSKQCRSLQRAGWEKDAAAVLRLASVSDKLVQLYLEDGKRQSAYQAKMHLATLARKVKAADAVVGCPGHERIFALLHTVEGVLAELKSQESCA